MRFLQSTLLVLVLVVLVLVVLVLVVLLVLIVVVPLVADRVAEAEGKDDAEELDGNSIGHFLA